MKEQLHRLWNTFGFLIVASLVAQSAVLADFTTRDVEAQIKATKARESKCGVLALQYALNYCDTPTNYDDILAKFTMVDSKGVRFGEIDEIATKAGLDSRMGDYSVASLLKSGFPIAIAVVDQQSHAVVLLLEHSTTEKVKLWDPTTLAIVEMSTKKLERGYSGSAIMLRPQAFMDSHQAWLLGFSILAASGVLLVFGFRIARGR